MANNMVNGVHVSEYGKRVVYRVVNGKRKRFTMQVVPTEYDATENTIGVRIGRCKQWAGKTDPTMILGSHK